MDDGLDLIGDNADAKPSAEDDGAAYDEEAEDVAGIGHSWKVNEND